MEIQWKNYLAQTLDSWNKKYLIISPDLDGLLSACLASHVYGSKIIGIYDTRTLMLFDNHTMEQAKEALWIDLDIQNKNILSFGHHILQIDGEELSRFNPNSFNPNVLYGLDWKKCFKDRTPTSLNKCPYSTITILLAFLESYVMSIPPNKGTKGFSLIAHADSLHEIVWNHNHNINLWKKMMFPHSEFIDNIVSKTYFTDINCRVHSSMVCDLRSFGIIDRSFGENKATRLPRSWEFTTGVQSAVGIRCIQKTIEYIGYMTGWNLDRSQIPKRRTSYHNGRIITHVPERLGDTNKLFEREPNIFSFAITFNKTIKSTVW